MTNNPIDWETVPDFDTAFQEKSTGLYVFRNGAMGPTGIFLVEAFAADNMPNFMPAEILVGDKGYGRLLFLGGAAHLGPNKLLIQPGESPSIRFDEMFARQIARVTAIHADRRAHAPGAAMTRLLFGGNAPQFAGIPAPKTYAAHPVWNGSARGEVHFAPVTKQQAVRIWHDARRWEAATRSCHGQGAARAYNGKLSRVGLAVLQALLFDFLNYKSGRLDPSYAAIAAKAGVSISSVYRSLVRLRDAGILSWVKRCSAAVFDGRYVLEQDSNAYGISPSTQWRGFRPAPDAPRPHPEAWGASPPMPPLAVQAIEANRAGDRQRAALLLGADPGDWIAPSGGGASPPFPLVLSGGHRDLETGTP